VNMNTLLTRKRLAVIYLRDRLKDIYAEFARVQTQPVAKKPGLSHEFKRWIHAVVNGGTAAKEFSHE